MPKHVEHASLVTVAVTLISPAKNPTQPPNVEHRFLRFQNPTHDIVLAALALDGAMLTVQDASFVYRLVSSDACEAHYNAFAFAVDSGLLPQEQAEDLIAKVARALPLVASNDANALFASRWFDKANALLDCDPAPLPPAGESGVMKRAVEPKDSDLDRLKRGAYDAAEADLFYQRRVNALRTLLGLSEPTGAESASESRQREQQTNDQLFLALIDGLREGVLDLEYWMDAGMLEAGNLNYALTDIVALLPAMYGDAAFDPENLDGLADGALLSKAKAWARSELKAIEAARKARVDELKERYRTGNTATRLERHDNGAEKNGTPARFLAGKLWCAHHLGVATTLELDDLTVAFSLVF